MNPVICNIRAAIRNVDQGTDPRSGTVHTFLYTMPAATTLSTARAAGDGVACKLVSARAMCLASTG
jgi:hypothetical protein